MAGLYAKFPPSPPCSCEICKSYCKRPGWWTVEEAARAIEAGYAGRMMLEISPDRSYGVLSPSFRGNEGNYAFQEFSHQGCTFFKSGLCELFETGLQPIECRFCHHDRKGQGKKCHQQVAKEWQTNDARRLIVRWGNLLGFWSRQGLVLTEKYNSLSTGK